MVSNRENVCQKEVRKGGVEISEERLAVASTELAEKEQFFWPGKQRGPTKAPPTYMFPEAIVPQLDRIDLGVLITGFVEELGVGGGNQEDKSQDQKKAGQNTWLGWRHPSEFHRGPIE